MASTEMLRLAVLSLALALLSALVTFTGLLGGAYWLGRTCFLVFLVSFIVTAAVTALESPPPG